MLQPWKGFRVYRRSAERRLGTRPFDRQQECGRPRPRAGQM